MSLQFLELETLQGFKVSVKISVSIFSVVTSWILICSKCKLDHEVKEHVSTANAFPHRLHPYSERVVSILAKFVQNQIISIKLCATTFQTLSIRATYSVNMESV